MLDASFEMIVWRRKSQICPWYMTMYHRSDLFIPAALLYSICAIQKPSFQQCLVSHILFSWLLPAYCIFYLILWSVM